MKRMLLVLVVGLTLFGLSGGVSYYLQQQNKPKQPENQAAPDKTFAKAALALSRGSAADAKDSVRASTASSPEHLAQLATNINKQQDTLRSREQTLLVRQKHLELIQQDLRDERKALDDLKQQVSQEMKAVTEKLEALERKAGDIDQQKKKMQDQAKEIKQTIYEMDSVEQKRIRQIAAMYDTMDAETAGEILQHMADSGKMDTAVKVLSTMQERQSAKVLAQMQDRATVVQLLDRLRGLKRPQLDK